MRPCRLCLIGDLSLFHQVGCRRRGILSKIRLNLVVAAITLWNTVYPERATEQMAKSRQYDPVLLQHASALGWEHINLIGGYTWHTNERVAEGGFRPLRNPRNGSSGP